MSIRFLAKINKTKPIVALYYKNYSFKSIGHRKGVVLECVSQEAQKD
jgi:hypothetical protein|tara:strand:+ start:364 stop:504 length:141 start_codon:yes stop_codon:yes gene_type:complete